MRGDELPLAVPAALIAFLRIELIVASRICAHIAGTVWRVDVSPGDDVDPGQAVVVLESMKMEMPVEASIAGRVRAVRVATGQFVEEGDPLVELE